MELDQVLKRYSSQLRGFISSRVNNKSDVDDILQEILIKTFRYFKNIDESDNLNAWIYKIARNTLTDYYRKNNKYSYEELEDLEEDKEEANETMQELSKCLKPFIQNLPDKYREPLELVEFGNISQKDLAEKMGLSYSGLKSRIQRARQTLHEQYKQCCDYEIDIRGGIINFKPKSNCCTT